MDISTREIASKKVRGNDMDFSNSDIIPIKVRKSNLNFLISEITLKKYMEMTRKLVEICASTYPRNIDVESTWIRLGVPLG